MSGGFATTRWSVVLAARGADPEGRAALATLCQDYWHPIYAFIRRQGHAAEQAREHELASGHPRQQVPGVADEIAAAVEPRHRQQLREGRQPVGK